jgi:hypothetical protein
MYACIYVCAHILLSALLHAPPPCTRLHDRVPVGGVALVLDSCPLDCMIWFFCAASVAELHSLMAQRAAGYVRMNVHIYLYMHGLRDDWIELHGLSNCMIERLPPLPTTSLVGKHPVGRREVIINSFEKEGMCVDTDQILQLFCFVLDSSCGSLSMH